MKYYDIANLGLYVLAKDIEHEAARHGHQIRRDKETNRTHPGSVCNQTIRQIKKTPGLQHKYRLRDDDVLSISPDASPENEKFIEMLKNYKFIHPVAINNGEGLQLYSKKAAEAILGWWLGDINVYLSVDETDVWPGKYHLVSSPKNLARKRDRKTMKLF